MAVIIDVGNPDDIHPTDKQDVGLRLAASALHVTYGQDTVFEGPTYKAFTVQGDAIQLSFDQVGEGLMIGSKDGKSTATVVEDAGGTLSGFAIAGADSMWKPATAVIGVDGKTVTVKSSDVPTPVAARYGWTDNPSCNLYNRQGLAATPFRTDPDYRVNVIDGNGSGSFVAGKAVTINANAPPANQRSAARYIFAPAATQSLISLICASVRHMRSVGQSSGMRAIISVPPPALLQLILPGPVTAFTSKLMVGMLGTIGVSPTQCAVPAGRGIVSRV
jgi:hypothetical protein